MRITTGRGKPHGLLYQGEALKAVVSGRRQIRRAEEIINMINATVADASQFDDRFFAVLSVYLCEEKKINNQLLKEELGRFL